MAFKMKGHTLPGIKQKNGGKVDPDAPGTPGKPGYEPPVHAMDYLTKTPAGPVAKKKTDDSGTLGLHLERRGDALGAPTAGQMENTGDFNISNLHKDTKISLNKKKSPAKMYGKKSPAKIAPLVQMAGKAIISGVVKKAMEKDSPAKMCGCGKKKCNC